VTEVRAMQCDGPPDLLRLQARASDRYPALLQSTARGMTQGRYDILLAAPAASLMLTADGRLHGEAARGAGFLDSLDAWWHRERVPAQVSELPFRGGWLLYLGYELAGEVEPRLRLPRGATVIAYALRCRAAAVFDHRTARGWLLAERGSEAALDELEQELQDPQAIPPPRSQPLITMREDAQERYLEAVGVALEHIRAGDIYQANLARAWRGTVPSGMSAADLYAALRESNPGPFSGIAMLPGMAVLSTSPERLMQVRDGWIETRPIAGTLPRAPEDAEAIRAFAGDAKERAEHVMLIDLERNDVGRVCEPGTVTVDEALVVESYAHVHHLVSNVRGRLRADATVGAQIRALFPGGTITGCPKVRCMELIAEIEGAARGAYTGSMGYLNRDGSLDLNILIRTATLVGDQLELRAGAGIVADSIPERELAETRAKARGLLRGLTGAS
jgi:4-amino-4-deoxychorismate synthase (2-amino-4-deoxychorismate-forming) component I